jgi:diketogulonate reductase-like aldo/keto reductase
MFARAKGCSSAQVVYRFAQLQNVTPLSGTTNEEHMRDDLIAQDITVDAETLSRLKEVADWMGLH